MKHICTRRSLFAVALLLAGTVLLLNLNMTAAGRRPRSRPARVHGDDHRRLPNLRLHWPQWRVGAGDSPEEAARRRWELARATQHAGTGARVQRFLEKAKRGEPFTIAAIGGSVSKGRGLRPPPNPTAPHLERRDDNTNASDKLLGADTLYSKENLHVLVFDWLNATFPHKENRFVNGAQGGVGAGYFAWCFKEHIYEDVDLVLVELGINDLNRVDGIPKFEHLVRSALELDSSPAMINIETFTTLFPALISSSSLHGDVLAYYDVPSLSIRDILLPRILADPDTQLPRWFRTGGDVALRDDKVREWGGVPVDLMHISAKGHALAAGLVINYLSSQLAQVAPSYWTRFKPWRQRTQRVYDVPSTSLTQSFNPQDLPEKRSPVCRSMNSGRLHNPVSGTDVHPHPHPHPHRPHEAQRVRGVHFSSASHGWDHWAWAEKQYMVARSPGALFVFDFVTSEGEEQTRNDHDAYPDPMDVYEPHEGESAPYDPDVEREEMEAEEKEKAKSRARRSINGNSDADADSDSDMEFDSNATAKRRNKTWSRGLLRKRSNDAHEHEHESEPSVAADGENGGTVAIGYQRSANYGLGSVFCWVDDDKDKGKRLDGYWTIKERNMGVVDAVATGLQPGRHRLQCELLEDTLDPRGKKEFRLFAVMHD